MPVRVVQLGTPRHRGEGLRLGTVRRPPRGVRKSEFAKGNWFDVWLPNLSPSLDLMRRRPIDDDIKDWRHVADFSVGCYCHDEQRCHRSILRRELEKRGAAIA